MIIGIETSPSSLLSLNMFSITCSSKSRIMSAFWLFSTHLMVRSRFFFTSDRRWLNVSVLICSLICNRSRMVQMPYSTILARLMAFLQAPSIMLKLLATVNKFDVDGLWYSDEIDRIQWKCRWQQWRQWRRQLQGQWFECSEWFEYNSDGFYEGYCARHWSLLCALHEVSSDNFSRRSISTCVGIKTLGNDALTQRNSSVTQLIGNQYNHFFFWSQRTYACS